MLEPLNVQNFLFIYFVKGEKTIKYNFLTKKRWKQIFNYFTITVYSFHKERT